MKAWWRSIPSIPTKFRYKVKHIPTNRSWIREKEFANRGEFLSQLAKWNRMDPSNWYYSEIKE